MSDAPTAPDVVLLLDVRAAARALAVSPRTVQNLAARGELPTVKIGKLTRYPLADLQHFIDARRQVPQPIGAEGATT
jgi:excisionase family DNA binding protein